VSKICILPMVQYDKSQWYDKSKIYFTKIHIAKYTHLRLYHWLLSLYTYLLLYPLTEEIRLKIFGSRDLTVFLINLSGDRDSVYTYSKLVWKFGDSRENVFDMYGDSRENLLELAVVIIGSPISSVWGIGTYSWTHFKKNITHTQKASTRARQRALNTHTHTHTLSLSLFESSR